jgi:hypothetical protein
MPKPELSVIEHPSHRGEKIIEPLKSSPVKRDDFKISKHLTDKVARIKTKA